MRKTRFFAAGMLVCLLAFGLAVVGCDNGTTGGTDTWSDVTSLAQVNGTWKGSSSTQTENGITRAYKYEFTMTINASAGTANQTIKETITYSGGDITSAWPQIRNILIASGFTCNDTNHSATKTSNRGPESITVGDMEGVQINRNGTQLKYFNEVLESDMILYKQ